MTNGSLTKIALVKMGFKPTEKEATENDEYNDVTITYQDEEYYGSSLVSMDGAYRDLLEDLPELLHDRVIAKMAEL